MKKIVSVLLTIILIFALSNFVYADEPDAQLRLSEATDAEIMCFLSEYGIEIPGGESNFDYWKEFIIATISSVEQNPNCEFVYSWTVSMEFANAIKGAVNDYYGNNFEYGISTADTYTLVNSVKAANWNDSYKNYNCYAYAIGLYYALDPGDIVGSSSNTMNAFMLSNLVLRDLEALNYECIQVYSYIPSSVPDGAKLICLRSGAYDYHFMKMYYGSWHHKPGRTLPLRWRYSSPAATIWTNECITYDEENNTYVHNGPSLQYDSNIYYFVFSSSHTAESDVYTGENYHSGNSHYYQHEYVCAQCGDTYFGWNSISCSGPPCPNYVPLSFEEVALEIE